LSDPLRIVFMGSPRFAIPSLAILLQNGYEIVSVVTTPDKPQGRGQQVGQSPVKEFSLSRNLPLLQPADLRDPAFIKALRSLQPHVFVVVAFRILPKEVYSIATRGAFNLHASLLPKYRGAAPINWAIIHGEKETGVTTFFLQEQVDTGSIILQARVAIGPDETAGELHDKLADVGAEIVLQTVRLIERGRAVVRPQDETQASVAPRIVKKDCRIPWDRSAQQVHNFVRGLSPSPTAWTQHGETRLKLYRTRLVSANEFGSDAEPGTIVSKSRDSLIVQTGNGCLSVLEIQQEGRRRMGIEEFLRGYTMKEGDRLV
jgi:methionyl-tRNA formyltransferase